MKPEGRASLGRGTAWTFVVAFVVAAIACGPAVRGRRDAGLRPQPAVDVVLNAFERYPLVALGEGAGHGQLDRPPLDPDYERELARRRALGDATQPFRGGRIRFDEGRAVLPADAGPPLDAVLNELRRDRELTLLVKAFSDSSEPDALTLSEGRATFIVDWLAGRGVARDRLIPRGCGTRRPLTFGETAADRARNRRAELVRLTPLAVCEPPW